MFLGIILPLTPQEMLANLGPHGQWLFNYISYCFTQRANVFSECRNVLVAFFPVGLRHFMV